MTDNNGTQNNASPFPPDKRGKHPNSLKNLRPPFRKGEVGNPTGKNGRHRSAIITAFMEGKDNTEEGRALIEKLGLPPNTPRVIALLQKEFIEAMKKSDVARKGLREAYFGKPAVAVDVTSNGQSIAAPQARSTAELRAQLVSLIAVVQSAVGAAEQLQAPTEQLQVVRERLKQEGGDAMAALPAAESQTQSSGQPSPEVPSVTREK